MNKENKQLQAMPYQTPSCQAFEMMPEGILCQSGQFGINDWEENEDVL